MAAISSVLEWLKEPGTRELFGGLYGTGKVQLDYQAERFRKAIDAFKSRFSQDDIALFSTPGRVEIGGNHTDHNNGRILAAAISLDTLAVAAKTDDNVMTVHSEGYDKPFRISLDELAPRKSEERGTASLIRGIAARFNELGHQTGGFAACITSDVGIGSGLSSSASFEVIIGTIINAFYNDSRISEEEIARIGQFAENTFFGKPCGLMDQMTCAVGGIITVDFLDPQKPAVTRVPFDFASQDTSICVIHTGESHADLTDDYASVPGEMKAVAGALGGDVLRQVSKSDLMARIPALRKKTGDRALLRAYHFFTDNERVGRQVAALQNGDFRQFLHLVDESGDSSFRWLQNCYLPENPGEQGIVLALMLTRDFLQGIEEPGACRVHGGGFAGTIIVFMPNSHLGEYTGRVKAVFGENAVAVLGIRSQGTMRFQIG